MSRGVRVGIEERFGIRPLAASPGSKTPRIPDDVDSRLALETTGSAPEALKTAMIRITFVGGGADSSSRKAISCCRRNRGAGSVAGSR